MKNVVVFCIQNQLCWLIFKAKFDQPGICTKILSYRITGPKDKLYGELGEMQRPVAGSPDFTSSQMVSMQLVHGLPSARLRIWSMGLFSFLFIYLAVLDLSFSMQTLNCSMWDLS